MHRRPHTPHRLAKGRFRGYWIQLRITEGSHHAPFSRRGLVQRILLGSSGKAVPAPQLRGDCIRCGFVFQEDGRQLHFSRHLESLRIVRVILFNLGVRDLHLALGDFLGQHLQLQLGLKFGQRQVALSQRLLELRRTGDAVLLFE